MPTTSITISDVERITALGDAVLRNLQITQCYHELSMVLAERTGRKPNWCSFATWASKQAGQTIRKEDLSRLLASALQSESAAVQAAHALQSAVQRLGLQLGIEEILDVFWKAYDPEAAFERSSNAVARGNLKVFAEIGREFARFNADCLPDPLFDALHIASFVDQLRAGDPPDGQRYLRQAFQRYYQALFEVDEKARTELLLLANLEVGYHEQTRLQPEINEALVAPVISPQDFARNLLDGLAPLGSRLSGLGWLILRVLGRLADFDRAIQGYVAGAQRQTQFLVTQSMMTIQLAPHHILRLGDDLADDFPPALQSILNPDLLDLLAQIDPTPNSPLGSGTNYWGDFSDRIHFIADMFRCYAAAEELFEPPFDRDQTEELKQGRVPAGRL